MFNVVRSILTKVAMLLQKGSKMKMLARLVVVHNVLEGVQVYFCLIFNLYIFCSEGANEEKEKKKDIKNRRIISL